MLTPGIQQGNPGGEDSSQHVTVYISHGGSARREKQLPSFLEDTYASAYAQGGKNPEPVTSAMIKQQPHKIDQSRGEDHCLYEQANVIQA